jgi:hypothetical protein
MFFPLPLSLSGKIKEKTPKALQIFKWQEQVPGTSESRL